MFWKQGTWYHIQISLILTLKWQQEIIISSLTGVLETQVVLFRNWVGKLNTKIPEILCQSVISSKFGWIDFIAICKVLSCYPLQTWMQSNITCCSCSLSTLTWGITVSAYSSLFPHVKGLRHVKWHSHKIRSLI